MQNFMQTAYSAGENT